MEIFTTILAYGYIFIVGFVFLIMVFQILSFYIAGRATGSIDDEITSAFTLFGALLLIGTASTLVNAVLTTFLSGMMVPAIASFALYLVVIIYAVVKIYELSIGKSILFLLLSLVITVVLSGLTVYVGTLVMPEVDLSERMEIEMNGFDTMEVGGEEDSFGAMEMEELPLDDTTETGDVMEAEEASEEPLIEEPETEPEETTEEPTPSGPGLPGTTQ